jgi:hypothetical protein
VQVKYHANILDAKNLLIDLILALQDQVEYRYGNYLEDLFQIGSSIFTDSFDIKLFIPLIEQVVNIGPDESIYNAVSDLARRLSIASPTLSSESASDGQPSPSSKEADSNDSSSGDEQFPVRKRAKLAHRDSNSEADCGGRESSHSTGVLNLTDGCSETALAESQTLQYRPLDVARREIRLLVLYSCKDSLSYSCNLIHVSMNGDLDYEALSYVWGSTANQKKIIINGQELSITANLAEALDHLWDKDGPRKLWVDAVCINQDDIPEKNQQVKMMTTIYERARKVVVWIGVLGIMTQRLLCQLEHLEDSDELPTNLRGWTASGARIPADPSFPLLEEDKRLLSELAHNPWFERIWVIQEVAVAKEVIVQTKHTTISWLAFGAALEKCSSSYEMKNVVESVKAINTIRTARLREPYYMDLFVLLEKFRHYLATNKSDKVFALQGLTSSSLAQEKVLHVIPDYSTPTVGVYKSLARQYITKRKNLDIICHATLSNHKAIPSWVPNWSYHNPGLSVLPKRRTVGTCYEPMYRCCGDLEIDRELLFDTESSSNRLWVNGFKFDTVSIVGSMATNAHDLGLEPPINGVTNLLKEWKSMSETCSHVYGSTWEDSFRRTLHADAIGIKRFYDSVQSAVNSTRSNGSALISYTAGGSTSEFVYLSDGRLGTVEKENEVSMEEQLNNTVDLYAESMKRATIKRTFFVTEKGYMGLGPFNMEEGDLVYVLAGGQVPFILRPIILTGGFSLVGESYVHGIMDGEATVLGIEIENIFLL